jgi:hypothetical protein
LTLPAYATKFVQMRGGTAFGILRSAILFGGLLGAQIVAASGCDDTMIALPTPSRSFIDASTDANADDPGCFGCNAPSPDCPPGAMLDCFVDSTCATPTTLTGTVLDPAGKNPLANVVVYVPEDPAHIAPIATGTSSCHTCETAVSDTVTATLTDENGHFKLSGVPTGSNIPVVVQIGKWQRVIRVASVGDCQTTQLPTSLTRLPRKRSEGSLPHMALLTGGCDNVACFLQNVGVDASEFSAPGAGGAVDVYQGLGATGPAAALSNGVAGDCTTSACPLWSSKQALEAYDAVFLGCECGAHDETKPPASLQAMHDWLGEGGRVFATHSQTTWFEKGPADGQSLAAWTDAASTATGPFAVNTTFQGGASLKSWLATVGALDANGFVTIDPADVSTSVTTVSSVASAWITDTPTPDGGARMADGGAQTPADVGTPSKNVAAFTARTPLDAGPLATCGSIDVTDIHPGGGLGIESASSDGSMAPADVPAACPVRDLNAGEKVLEYLFFNQSACVGGGSRPPPLPPPGG